MPLLSVEPSFAIDSLSDLLGVALAMEQEAARRYRVLAALMERNGQAGTAATLRKLAGEEDAHEQGIAGWAHDLVAALPAADPYLWQLPPDIARSWDEVEDSGLLTPYRALAIAVHNEERAFAFYTYVAAHASEGSVREAAEHLAKEELGHAAMLRRERRKAWRRERAGKARSVSDLDELEDRAAGLSATAAAHHRQLADAVGTADPALAQLLAELARDETNEARGTAAAPPPTASATLDLREVRRQAALPLEQLAELFEDAAAEAQTEDMLTAAQAGLQTTVARLVRVMA